MKTLKLKYLVVLNYYLCKNFFYNLHLFHNCKDISLDLEQFLFTHLLIEDPYFDYDDENDYENNIDNTIYESDL